MAVNDYIPELPDAVCRDDSCPREDVHPPHAAVATRGRPKTCRWCGARQSVRGAERCERCGKAIQTHKPTVGQESG